ncbi:MAG: hypothetical protein S4CHLAM81_02330 [Chlamydiales bacterium]|nr:hypothetical protein [Chlamydiales bacterium]MCH9635025.1 hypothetical protein [Chlamydiales bacterium]MCH9704441.1 hypothetical protein [Chlamydiota bacterium]
MGPLPSQADVAAMFSKRHVSQGETQKRLYGGNHEKFANKCAQMILAAAEQLRAQPHSELFLTFFNQFREGRRAIMIENDKDGSYSSTRFGAYRGDPERKHEPFNMLTTLYGFEVSGYWTNGYEPLRAICSEGVNRVMDQVPEGGRHREEYEIAGYSIHEEGEWAKYETNPKRLLKKYSKAFSRAEMLLSLKEDVVKKMGVNPRGKKKKGDLYIIDPKDIYNELKNKGFPKHFVEVACAIFVRVLDNPKALKELKESAPKFYAKLRLQTAMNILGHRTGVLADKYSIVSSRVCVPFGGKLCNVTFSKRVTLTKPDGTQSTELLHQDLHLLHETIQALGQMFKEAMRESDFSKLKERVALFRWSYGNACPNWRGDGAIGNMLELLIYIAKGYRPRYAPDSMPSGECLVRGPRAFVEAYNEIVLFDDAVSPSPELTELFGKDPQRDALLEFVAKINQAAEPQSLFLEQLQIFQQFCKQLKLEILHQDGSVRFSKNYGQRRDDPTTEAKLYSQSGIPQSLQAAAATRVSTYLEKLEPDTKSRQFKQENRIFESQVAGYQVRTDAILHSGMEQMKWSLLSQDIALLKQVGYPIDDAISRAVGGAEDAVSEAFKNLDVLGQIRVNFPEKYREMRLAGVTYVLRFQDFLAGCPSKSYEGLIEVNQQLCIPTASGVKTIPLSSLFSTYSWGINQDGTVVSPPDCMKSAKRFLLLQHQDCLLIEETLPLMAEIFAEAVREQEENLFLEKVALLQWVYTNCAPCLGGDALIGEWLEMALLMSRGLKPAKIPRGMSLVMGAEEYISFFLVNRQK